MTTAATKAAQRRWETRLEAAAVADGRRQPWTTAAGRARLAGRVAADRNDAARRCRAAGPVVLPHDPALWVEDGAGWRLRTREERGW